jgi:DNA invertase Pin-like site-specific DNA recombinase
MPLYGYARVSTREQDLSSQDAELRAAGCAKVFREKASGAKTDRPELAKVIRRIEKGDVLIVTRLDRAEGPTDGTFGRPAQGSVAPRKSSSGFG